MKQKFTVSVEFDASEHRQRSTLKQAMGIATDRLIEHLDDIVHDNGRGYFTLLTGDVQPTFVDFRWEKAPTNG